MTKRLSFLFIAVALLGLAPAEANRVVNSGGAAAGTDGIRLTADGYVRRTADGDVRITAQAADFSLRLATEEGPRITAEGYIRIPVQ